MRIPQGVGPSARPARGEQDEGGLRKLGGRIVGEGPATTLEVAQYQLPDGRRKEYAIVHRPHAAGVIPFRPCGDSIEVMLVVQPRAAVNDAGVIEIVAGKMDEPGEDDPRLTAERELAEEAGLRARGWMRLAGGWYPSSGYTDEEIHIFAAWGLTSVPKREEDRHISSIWMPIEEAVSKVTTSEIRDGKTREAIWSINHR